MRHAGRVIEFELRDAIVGGIRWRNDLADPVRSLEQRPTSWQLGNAILAQAKQIGPNDVISERDVDLRQKPPASGTATASLEGVAKLDRHLDGRATVIHPRGHLDDQLIVNQLGMKLISKSDHIRKRVASLRDR